LRLVGLFSNITITKRKKIAERTNRKKFLGGGQVHKNKNTTGQENQINIT
jgi:hypothetical protein